MYWISLGLIFVPIIIAITINVFPNDKINYSVFLNQLLITIGYVYMLTYISAHDSFSLNIGGWAPGHGIELMVDKIAVVFIGMTVFIWWIVLIYSWNTMKKDHKYMFFLLFLEGSFIALLQAHDLFTLFVLIETITIISTILILYKKEGESVKSALYYLLFNSFGISIYLIGLMILYINTGTLNMTLTKIALMPIGHTDLIKFSYACIIVAMGVKSAIFPVYDWLPRAHSAAPAAISALLSGLMVKTGIYCLIRIHWIYDFDAIMPALFYIGLFTALSGVIFAVSQKDIKMILAFHTISQVGIIIMGMHLGNELGFYGGLAHLFNHFLFKSLLFLCVGIIINIYGTRNVNEIRGLYKSHPMLALCVGIGILSITGAPLFLGFISKTLIKKGMVLSINDLLFHVVNMGTLISFIKFSQIFTGQSPKKTSIASNQYIAIAIMSFACIVTIIFEQKIIIEWFNIDIKPFNIISLKSLSEYILLSGIAFFIYKRFISSDFKAMQVLRHFSISFQNANFLLVCFFLLILAYLRLV